MIFYLVIAWLSFGSLAYAQAAKNETELERPTQIIDQSTEYQDNETLFDKKDFSRLIQIESLPETDQRAWDKLMYYGQGASPISRVNISNFFWHSEGRRRPIFELQAQIRAILEDKKAQAADAGLSNTSFSCRFPARRIILERALKLPQEFNPSLCPELNEWLSAIQPHGVTLVYASTSMDGPSSMFGHTLLRIDQSSDNPNPLLNYAISYAAETDPTDNPVWYAARGLFGLYPGSYAMLPFYEKTKEYSDIEGRDLWEYQLNLTEKETLFLLEHFWELKAVRFPYYYFHSNCAYELLHLLEAVRPNLKLQEMFSLYTIPSESIKAVTQTSKLLKDTKFRPALTNRVSYTAAQSPKSLVNLASTLKTNPDTSLDGLNIQDQGLVYELAYDQLYAQHISQPSKNQTATQTTLRTLLLKRSLLNTPEQRKTVPAPSLDPARGHADGRIKAAYGATQNDSVIDIELRPAFHDPLDPQGGYKASSGIDFLNTKFRYEIKNHQIQIQELNLVTLHSYPTISNLNQPTTLHVSVSWQRIAELDESKEDIDYKPTWRLQAGKGWAWGNDEHLACYVQSEADILISGRFRNHARLGIGPRLGCHWYPDSGQEKSRWQLTWHAQPLYWTDRLWRSEWQAGAQYNLNQQTGLRAQWQQSYLNKKSSYEYTLGLVRYF